MARTKYRMNVRRFLNRKGFHSSAHIIAKVEDTTGKDNENDYLWPDIELVIADCSRSISLAFELNEADERQNSMYKLDRLISDLEQFRGALRAEARLAAARERVRKEKKAAKKRKAKANA